MSNVFKLNWTDLKSGIVSLALTVLLAVGLYIIEVGNIFEIDWYTMANIGAMAGIVFLVSIIKSLLTTKNGDFAGAIKIK